jgi:hypothetical protein
LITPHEREAHAAFVAKELGEAAIWNAAPASTN